MQPHQYDLRCRAAKDNNITHAAAAPSSLDEAIPTRSAKTCENYRKLSCKAQENHAQQRQKLQLQNAFRARLSSKIESGRYENEAFTRDFPQKVKVEDMKTKVSCETFLKSESGRYENEGFVRDFPQKVKALVGVKTKLSCETSLTKSVKLKI